MTNDKNDKKDNESAGNPGLSLPPMSSGGRNFATIVFFLAGVALTAFALLNPLGLPFLPQRGADRGETAVADASRDEPVQLYQCPMHPEVIENHPDICPICNMNLMPMQQVAKQHGGDGAPGSEPKEREKEAGHAGSDDPGVIAIDPVQVQNMGVVSRLARVGEVARTVRTVGILDFNADLITWVNTKFAGWIEKVHVNYVGQEVREGQALFEIYSPELVTTQEEYLRALDYKTSLENSSRVETRRQAESLLRSTRDRLTYWDIGEDQILELETSQVVQRRITIRSPVDGVVAQVMEEALEGMFVKAGMNLYKIVDLSSLWVHADVYESDLPWVRKDQPAEVFFRNAADRVFRGKILFLYPEVSKETRTLKICVEVPNRDRRLRAGMYADVVLHGPPVLNAVLIPDSAVLRSGERDLVFVDLGEGRFEPREVELGVRGEGHTVQIVRGLADGEAVVTQAQFMLDSESRVQEAIAKFMRRGLETQR